MNQSTSEVQTNRETMLEKIRSWERELDELSAENGQVVLKASAEEDRKLVAHFENQFTIEKNRLDKMKHNIKITGGNANLESELEEFESYFDKLRSEFTAFSEGLL